MDGGYCSLQQQNEVDRQFLKSEDCVEAFCRPYIASRSSEEESGPTQQKHTISLDEDWKLAWSSQFVH